MNLRLDTSLQQDKLPCQTYVSRSLALGDKTLGTGFMEVPCDVQYGDVERVGGEQGVISCRVQLRLQRLINKQQGSAGGRVVCVLFEGDRAPAVY